MGRYSTRADQEAQYAVAAAARLAAMTPEQLADKAKIDALVEAGGQQWWADDNSKHRVYFNRVRIAENVEITCYFDAMGKTWHEQRGTLMTDDVLSSVRASLGI